MDNAQTKTVIAEDIEIVGSVKAASDIHLAGKLNGDLNCNGNAIVGETANIKGNITANATTVMGQINGNISVKDRVELKATARINGDIRAKRLTVEDGATFVGKSEVNPAGAPAGRSTDGDEAASEVSIAADGADKAKGVFAKK